MTKIEVVKKIRVGSSVFFEKFPDYKKKDTDWIALVTNHVGKDRGLRVNIGKDDIFMFSESFTKEDFIKNALNSDVGMRLGKFLAPEFIEYFHVTIDDLERLKPLVGMYDEKHNYETIIYNAYIENNKMELTDEQIETAYKEYKRARA